MTQVEMTRDARARHKAGITELETLCNEIALETRRFMTFNVHGWPSRRPRQNVRAKALRRNHSTDDLCFGSRSNYARKNCGVEGLA
jgi:hypothetical protein